MDVTGQDGVGGVVRRGTLRSVILLTHSLVAAAAVVAVVVQIQNPTGKRIPYLVGMGTVNSWTSYLE